MKEVHISDIARAEIRAKWRPEVHIEADRRPFLASLSFRVGKYSGEGMRRSSKGGFVA